MGAQPNSELGLFLAQMCRAPRVGYSQPAKGIGSACFRRYPRLLDRALERSPERRVQISHRHPYLI